jgi:hypothetical protein
VSEEKELGIIESIASVNKPIIFAIYRSFIPQHIHNVNGFGKKEQWQWRWDKGKDENLQIINHY